MQKLTKKDVLSALNITLRLFAVCTVIAILVASVNFITKDRIKAYELQKTTSALDSVFSGEAIKPEYREADFELSGSVTGIYEVYDNSELLGYGVLCAPNGFKDAIKMLVAFDCDNTIIAVKVISLSETAGIGDKVMKDEFFVKQFEGKKNSITLGNDGVDAIAGATVSSKSVTKGVNDAISMIKIYTSGKSESLDSEVLTNG